jgi:hypothetical protein
VMVAISVGTPAVLYGILKTRRLIQVTAAIGVAEILYLILIM